MTHIYTLFGSTALPGIEPEGQVGLGPVAFTASPIALGGAFNPYGATGRAVRQGSILQYLGQYETTTNTALQTAMDAMRAKIGRQDKLWIQMLADLSTRWVYAVLLDVGGTLTGAHVLYADTALMFHVLSPVWNGATLKNPGFAIPETTPTAVTPITNSGNANVTDLVISFQAVGGTVTAISVTSSTTGHAFTWAGTLLDGEVLEIDCGRMAIGIAGSNEYANFNPPGGHERWMELAAGVNSWTVTVTGADADLLVEYYDAWA